MSLGQEYLLLVFFSCCGTVQVAAGYGNLRGLMFLNNRYLSSLSGMLLVIGSIIWFFRDGGRHIPDTDGGLAGNEQFMLFVLGSFLALLFTFLTTSIINFRKSHYVDTIEGLPSLRHTTFVKAVSNNFGEFWKLCLKQIRKYSSG